MNPTIRKVFSVFLIILFISFSHTSSAADSDLDATTRVICNIIKYVWGIGGPLMTIVIIGAALLAIFGRMPWPALFALGVFCAVFFGAKSYCDKSNRWRRWYWKYFHHGQMRSGREEINSFTNKLLPLYTLQLIVAALHF